MVVECKRLRYTSSAATSMRAVTKRCGDGSSSGSCHGSDDDKKSGEEDAVGAFPSHPKSNPIFQKGSNDGSTGCQCTKIPGKV